MKYLNKLFLALLVAFSANLSAQSDIVCIEITNEGESFVVPISIEELGSFDDLGITYEVVDCEGLGDVGNGDWEDYEEEDWGDFDFGDGDYGVDWEDFDFGDGDYGDYDYSDLVCVELTDGEASIIFPLVEEKLGFFDADGIYYYIVDCEGLGDFGNGDWGDYEEEDWGDFDFGDGDYGDDWEDFDFGDGDYGDFEDLVCIELDCGGQVVILPVIEATLAELDAEGLEYTVVDCEGLGDFDNEDWGDYEKEDWGDVDFGDIDYDDFEGDIICLEISDGEVTIVIPAIEEMLADLDADGISYTIVDCDGGLEDIDPEGYVIDSFSGEYTIDQLSVFPNPSTNSDLVNINFDSGSEGVITVALFNQLGQTAKDIQFTANKGNNTIQIDSSDLESGVYIVSVTNGSNINTTERLIVK